MSRTFEPNCIEMIERKDHGGFPYINAPWVDKTIDMGYILKAMKSRPIYKTWLSWITGNPSYWELTY
jgi:hypothetical protein